MVRPVLDFWFELASAYSYLAAMRIEARAERAGVTLRWRPFLLGPVFRAQGWNDSPFNIYPAKGRYMWRDLARICERERLPLKVPPLRFPQNGLKAARLALVGEKAGWIADFTRAVYVANFARAEGYFRRHSAPRNIGDAWCHVRRAHHCKHAREQSDAQGSKRRRNGARNFRRAKLYHWRRAVLGK